MVNSRANWWTGRSVSLLAFVFVVTFWCGCAPKKEQALTNEGNPGDVVAGGEVGYGPSPAIEAPVIDDAADETASTVTEAAGETQPRSSEPSDIRRRDGRPSWWIDDASRDHGEVVVAAEALGPTIREARRAAIDAGVTRLERALGREPADWVVKAAMIQPLRAVRGPESVNKFVGYVLIAEVDG